MLQRTLNSIVPSISPGKANSVKELREVLSRDSELKADLRRSLEQPRNLLEEQMKRLSLKNKPFQCFPPATDQEIQEMWQNCLLLDETLKVRMTINYLTS